MPVKPDSFCVMFFGGASFKVKVGEVMNMIRQGHMQEGKRDTRHHRFSCTLVLHMLHFILVRIVS